MSTKQTESIENLAATLGKEADQLQELLQEMEPSPQQTSKKRKEGARKAIESLDLEKLLNMQRKMVAVIDVLTANDLEKVDGEIDPDLAYRLMSEFLDERDVAELLEVRKGMIREAVFSHITSVLTREGDEDPEHSNGSLEVPELGRKFTREGGARGKPSIDEDTLKEKLGDRWKDVTTVEVIPEHTEQQLDSDLLVALANRDPEVMEIVRESLVPGNYRTPRFHVRDI